MDKPVNDEELAWAISKILRNCKQNENITVVEWQTDLNGDINIKEINDNDIINYVNTNINVFKARGGLLVLLYSAILTKGIQNIRKEAELPLVVMPFNICTTDLMILLLAGNANGNVGAYD